jgi:hypothetical protein
MPARAFAWKTYDIDSRVDEFVDLFFVQDIARPPTPSGVAKAARWFENRYGRGPISQRSQTNG